MNDLSNFTISSPRSLPVIILADTSGSMSENGKIDALNSAIAEMISSFTNEDDFQTEIQVCVITFGKQGANVSVPLQPAAEIKWESMVAQGHTPMAEAFNLLQEMMEDKNQFPLRNYRPMLILVSDGQPTDKAGKPSDDWKDSLEKLLASENGSKAYRFAMGIGLDADQQVLKAFMDNPELEVFAASGAREIRKYFQWLTISVTSRTKSVNPNSFVKIDIADLDRREI